MANPVKVAKQPYLLPISLLLLLLYLLPPLLLFLLLLLHILPLLFVILLLLLLCSFISLFLFYCFLSFSFFCFCSSPQAIVLFCAGFSVVNDAVGACHDVIYFLFAVLLSFFLEIDAKCHPIRGNWFKPWLSIIMIRDIISLPFTPFFIMNSSRNLTKAMRHNTSDMHQGSALSLAAKS